MGKGYVAGGKRASGQGARGWGKVGMRAARPPDCFAVFAITEEWDASFGGGVLERTETNRLLSMTALPPHRRLGGGQMGRRATTRACPYN